MTARQHWTGADYDAWLERGRDDLDDERHTVEQELCEIELDIAHIRIAMKQGSWDEATIKRRCQEAADRFLSLPELMDQEATARP